MTQRGGTYCLLRRLQNLPRPPQQAGDQPQTRWRPDLCARRLFSDHSINRLSGHALRRGRAGGMVLILVLIWLGLMAALATQLYGMTWQLRQRARRQMARARLQAALLDEAFRRLQEVAADPQPTFDHGETFWMGTQEWERPDGLVVVSHVSDLNRYLDLNNLYVAPPFAGPNETERILLDVMRQAGDAAPGDRVAALMAWIQPPDARVPGVAFQVEGHPPYRAPGTALLSWGELQWIRGFTPDYLQQASLRATTTRTRETTLLDWVTLVPGPRSRPVPINLNTAPLPLLEALLGPGQEALARYIALMRTERPLRSTAVLAAALSPVLLQRLQPFMDVRATHIRLEAEAAAENDQVRLYVVAERDTDGSVRILHWSW